MMVRTAHIEIYSGVIFNFHRATFHTWISQACNCEMQLQMPNESAINRIPEQSCRAHSALMRNWGNWEAPHTWHFVFLWRKLGRTRKELKWIFQNMYGRQCWDCVCMCALRNHGLDDVMHVAFPSGMLPITIDCLRGNFSGYAALAIAVMG